MAKSTGTRIFSMAAAVSMLLVAASALANTLQSVKVGQGSGQEAQVLTIALSEALTSTPMHFTTTNPHRIVIDLPGIQNPQGRASETVNTGVIRSYNIAQTADRTRVVVDLTGPATYDLKNEGNRVLVTLRGSDNAPGTAASAHFDSSPSASSATASVQDVVFRRGKNSESRVEVALSDPGVGVDIKQKGKTIQIDFLNTALPQNLMRRLDVSEFATPAQTVETFTQGTNTRMVVTPKGKWDYFAYQTGKNFILEVTPIDAGNKASGKKRYDGERLSLDFQDVDVRAVLKVIADFTGLNIVAAESVKGSVTVRLKDVPWDQALDIILLTKGLDKRENGNVIWVAPSKEMADKEKERMDAAEIEELQTEIVRLNYMRAPDAYAILTGKSINSVQAGQKVTCSTQAQGVGGRKETASGSTGNAGASDSNSMLSKRGTVNFDLKTNSVLIQDTSARLEKMKALLNEIDVPARQVMIEARIVVADDSFSRSLGARLGFKARIGSGFGISSDANDALKMASGGISSTNTVPYNVDLGANTSFSSNNPGIIGLSLIDASNAILGLELEALEADNRGKIISNPRVITQNQQPAVILQGQQIPYVTAHGTAEAATTEFKDALLCLLVDPQVLNNDDIIMNVEVQKDAPTTTSDGAIAIDTKRVKTQVRVKNGETVVLGGIFEQEQANNTEKIPLLGDIPVLGLLFRNNYKVDSKTELMVFLTPRLLNDAVSLK